MKTVIWLCALLAISLGTSCSERSSSSPAPADIQFRFSSSEGLTRGARVIALGSVVGQVTDNPRIADDGKSIVVEASIDQQLVSLQPRLNRRMTAQIEQSSLVAGETVLVLYFCNKPGEPMNPGEILDGCDSLVELTAWRVMCEGPSTADGIDRFVGLVLETDRAKIGEAVYWLNVVTFVALAWLVGCLVIDLFLRLLQGAERTRSSPAILLTSWRLFLMCVLLKVLVLAGILISSATGYNPPDLRPWFVMPEAPLGALRAEVRFLIVTVILGGIRLKLNLLTTVSKRILP